MKLLFDIYHVQIMDGDVIRRLRQHIGVIGHFHIQTNKIDLGPALDWDKVVDGAKRALGR